MKKSIVASIIVILILLFSVIFLFIQNQSLEKEISALNNKISELEKNKPEPVKPEPITDKIPEGWKEYIDKEYKFKIWYPEEYTEYGQTTKVRVEKLINHYGIKDNWIKEIHIYMPFVDIPVGLRIYIYSNDNQDIKSFIKNNIGNLTVENINDLEKYIFVKKIDNIVFYQVAIPDEPVRYYLNNEEYIFVLKSGDIAIELTDKLKSTFDQMVYSFKFLE